MNNNESNSGMGFIGTLTIVFIILKLCKVITWSWWWVLSPMWISILISLIIFGLVMLYTIIGGKE